MLREMNICDKTICMHMRDQYISAGMLATALFVGCSPVSDTERAYMDQRKQQQQQQAELAKTMESGVEDSEIIQMVKDSASPLEGLTTSEWTQEMISRYPGDVMFERWIAVRQGREKYKVEFTFTVMGENNMISKQGWSWTANQVLKLVGPPEEVATEDKARQRNRYEVQRDPKVAPLLNLE